MSDCFLEDGVDLVDELASVTDDHDLQLLDCGVHSQERADDEGA